MTIAALSRCAGSMIYYCDTVAILTIVAKRENKAATAVEYTIPPPPPPPTPPPPPFSSQNNPGYRYIDTLSKG